MKCVVKFSIDNAAFSSEANAVAAYRSAVNCGAVVHEDGNAIVRIKCERV